MRTAHDRVTGAKTTLDGAALRKLRTSNELTMGDVARATGVAVATVSSIELEMSMPSQVTIDRLRVLFGDSLDNAITQDKA